METIIRHVRDINSAERRVLEHVIGRRLDENQKVIFQVVASSDPTAESTGARDTAGQGKLPDWCNVYAGLSDEEIAEVERIVLQRADLTRPSE
jgi:hypothetical protein